jgi:GT2 family glycosyltransferase
LPELEFVQFVDGDCELVEGWIERAVAHARAHEKAAVVCGRRRERHPEASVYNRMCDIEWDSPIGLALSCGGDALMRAAALRQVDGYNPELIAGEEPDLCRRLRRAGFEVWRIDAEMTLHDADMRHFAQWWKRNVRAGHAYAEAWYRERRYGEGTAQRQILSNLAWSLPLAWPAWPALWWRVYEKRRDAAYAAFTVLGKLPQTEGQLRYLSRKLRRVRGKIIEYK